MSNLSELLPSGGGQNVGSFVASGTLTNGKPVALKTDGKVEAVFTTSNQAGSVFEVTTTAVVGPTPVSAYATNADRMVIVYSIGGTLYYKLGEVSSFGITLGSQTAIPTISTSTNQQAICYDETSQRIVVFFKDTNNFDYGTAIAGTVSTSGITWGTAAVYNSTNTNYTIARSGGGKVCVVFTEYHSGTGGSAILGTISGNNITFPGTRSRFIAGNANQYGLVYSEDYSKFVVFYNQETTAAASTPLIPNGNNITLGSELAFNSARTDFISAAYDKTKNKTVIVYLDNSSVLRGIVGTAQSGTQAMSFGAEANAAGVSGADGNNIAYDPYTEQCVLVYGADDINNYIIFRKANIVGTDVTFGVTAEVDVGANGVYYFSLSPYTTENKLVTTFYGASNHADGVVYQGEGTNSANFIGITGQAISDTATGNVDMLGGINSQQTSLVIGSKYYVQGNGTLGTTVTSIFAGQAVSATTLNIRDLT